MPAGVCDAESVYWCSGDFFYCSTCEEEYMSDLLEYFTLVRRAQRYFVSRGVVVRCLMST